ncbi:11359_t:CDS:1, partial [Paraglomus brasilianum]
MTAAGIPSTVIFNLNTRLTLAIAPRINTQYTLDFVLGLDDFVEVGKCRN